MQAIGTIGELVLKIQDITGHAYTQQQLQSLFEYYDFEDGDVELYAGSEDDF